MDINRINSMAYWTTVLGKFGNHSFLSAKCRACCAYENLETEAGAHLMRVLARATTLTTLTTFQYNKKKSLKMQVELPQRCMVAQGESLGAAPLASGQYKCVSKSRRSDLRFVATCLQAGWKMTNNCVT
jgi:hypothetical protein